MEDLSDVADERECTLRPDDGTPAMTVPFLVAYGDTIVFPMESETIRAWYEDKVRAGARDVTVDVAGRALRGKARVEPWQGVYEWRGAFAEKYRDLPEQRRKVEPPAMAVEFDPWW